MIYVILSDNINRLLIINLYIFHLIIEFKFNFYAKPFLGRKKKIKQINITQLSKLNHKSN